MSAGLYGSVGGVNRQIKKLYAPVGGVNREIKELWAAKDGVNRKIFSGSDVQLELRSYSNLNTFQFNDDGSGYANIYCNGSNGTYHWNFLIDFLFDDPIAVVGSNQVILSWPSITVTKNSSSDIWWYASVAQIYDEYGHMANIGNKQNSGSYMGTFYADNPNPNTFYGVEINFNGTVQVTTSENGIYNFSWPAKTFTLATKLVNSFKNNLSK